MSVPCSSASSLFWITSGSVWVDLYANSSSWRNRHFLILRGREEGNASTGNLRGQIHSINITFDRTTRLRFKHTCGFLHREAAVEQERTLPESSSSSASHCPQIYKTQRPQREEITPNNITSFSPVLNGDSQTDVFTMFKWHLLANLVHVCFDHIHTNSLQFHILLSTQSPSFTI